MKVSSANGLYAHKAFIETEFSHNKEAKNLECQGYNYESNPSTQTFGAFTKRDAETRSSATVTVINRVIVINQAKFGPRSKEGYSQLNSTDKLFFEREKNQRQFVQ